MLIGYEIDIVVCTLYYHFVYSWSHKIYTPKIGSE